MTPIDAAKRILEIAVSIEGPFFRHQLGPVSNQRESGIEYACRREWIEVCGVGHFMLTDAGRQEASPI